MPVEVKGFFSKRSQREWGLNPLTSVNSRKPAAHKLGQKRSKMVKKGPNLAEFGRNFYHSGSLRAARPRALAIRRISYRHNVTKISHRYKYITRVKSPAPRAAARGGGTAAVARRVRLV